MVVAQKSDRYGRSLNYWAPTACQPLTHVSLMYQLFLLWLWLSQAD